MLYKVQDTTDNLVLGIPIFAETDSVDVDSREMTYTADDRFVSFSTCSYEFENARNILTGKLVETKEV